MPEGLGARLAIENGFLILLAVGAAVAELEPLWIVVVMAIGWLLVALVELLAWRARPAYAWTPVPAAPFEEAPPAVYEPVPHAPPLEPEPEYPPAPVAPAPVAPAPVAPAPQVLAEPEPAAAEPEPEPVEAEVWPASPAATDYEFAFSQPEPTPAERTEVTPPEPEPPEPREEHATTLFQRPGAHRQRFRLEPLQPRPKRSWFRRTAEREPTPPPGEEQG